MHANELSRFELKELIEKDYVAILPIGSCEQHGPHLPITTDSNLAEYMSNEIAKRYDVIVFPTLNFGYSWVWNGLPGTITLSQNTFKMVVYELASSLSIMGFKKVLLVNGHDSNKTALKYVVRDLSEKFETKYLNIFYPNMNEIYKNNMESDMWHGMFHADEFETSLMLAYDDKKVRLDKLIKEYPDKPRFYGYDDSPLWNVSKSGVFGDATKASKNKGIKMMDQFMIEIDKLLD